MEFLKIILAISFLFQPTTKRLIIVVDADTAMAANVHAKVVDRDGGEKTFTNGLSASGQEPATHYWCNWAMRDNEETSIKALTLALKNAGKVRIYDAQTITPQEVLSQLGLRRIDLDPAQPKGKLK